MFEDVARVVMLRMLLESVMLSWRVTTTSLFLVATAPDVSWYELNTPLSALWKTNALTLRVDTSIVSEKVRINWLEERLRSKRSNCGGTRSSTNRATFCALYGDMGTLGLPKVSYTVLFVIEM